MVNHVEPNARSVPYEQLSCTTTKFLGCQWGPARLWTPPQYPWAVPQLTLVPPPQATSPPLNLANTSNNGQPIAAAVQTLTQILVTTTVTTTVPAPMMNTFSVRNAVGNFQLKIFNHVPLTFRNKVWQYQYINLGSLLNTEHIPGGITYDF